MAGTTSSTNQGATMVAPGNTKGTSMATDSSTRYDNAIQQAQAWFAERLPALPEIHISQADYRAGTDGLRRADLGGLVAGCFGYMIADHNYELSYSQQCRAFFGAAAALNRLHVT